MADVKMLKAVIGENHAAALEESKAMSEKTIAAAATTRLEFITVNALLNLSKAAGLEEITPAERLYSSKFKLRREEHVHAVVLKKRSEVWK